MGSQLVRKGSAEFLLSELFQEAPCSPKSAGVLLPGIQQEPQHLLHVCTICQLHSDRQEGTPKSHHNCLKIVKIPLPSLVKLYSSHCLKKSLTVSSWINSYSGKVQGDNTVHLNVYLEKNYISQQLLHKIMLLTSSKVILT